MPLMSNVRRQNEPTEEKPMSESPASLQPNSTAGGIASPPSSAIQFPLLQVLLFATVVNFVLIFGGTIYSQITVLSIQKTFQEAESRLNESKAKYLEASTQLEQQRTRATQTSKEIDSLIKSFDKVDSQLSELKKENARKLDSIADEARAQLAQLRVEKANVGTALQAFEADVKGTVTQNSAKIRADVESHMAEARSEITRSKDRLQLLSNEIAEQKAVVDKRN
jgi:peptidoglycan hydrolase CwlO-like protein